MEGNCHSCGACGVALWPCPFESEILLEKDEQSTMFDCDDCGPECMQEI